MIGALVYLHLTSLKNAVRARLARLRQPKYLIAALVALAYFYFFFLRPLVNASGRRPPAFASVDLVSPQLAPVAALFLLGISLIAWMNGRSRAALAFTEAEIAFLFPAPVPRRTLIHYKLLRAQAAILLSALFLSLLSRRSAMVGGGYWMHAMGWWIISSLVSLHLLGISFWRERLLDFGVRPGVRRMVAAVVVVAVGTTAYLWLQDDLNARMAQVTDPASLLAAVHHVLSQAPLSWILWPFKLAVAPLFATSPGLFLQALWPAFLLLVAHYFWVVHSAVAFEEASVALAEKQATLRTAIKEGRLPLGKIKPRREPFRLPPSGNPLPAFLWKGLISAGRAYYPVSWLAATAVVMAATAWLARRPDYLPFLKVALGASAGIAAYALLIGPVFFRNAAHRMLQGMDVFKAYPLKGWQVVLGELSMPLFLLTAVEITLLSICATGLLVAPPRPEVTAPLVLCAASGWCLVAPALIGLLYGINVAGVLVFPAWSGAGAQNSQGFEVMGQRMILFFGYLVALVVALFPAAIAGAAGFLPLYLWVESPPAAILVGAVLAACVLWAEFAAMLWWLGRRYEAFDVSADLPR